MGISVLAFDVRLARTESQTIVVPDDFPTIQEAINSAVDGDTILVTIGIYYENVVVNKTVSLVGEDSSTTIIDGNETGHVIDVVSDNVNITNFTVRRGGNTMFPYLDAGISLNNVKGCKISSNNITDNGCFGVHLLNSDQNTISGNNLTRNAMYAIDLTTSHNNTISSNAAIFNANIGIGMHVSSQENIIMGNMIISNIYGIDAAHVSENVISGNYLANNSEIGIWIQDYAVNNTVIGNNVTGSHYCIKIQEQANYNIISQNNIGRNDYGFYIVSSTQNSIHHNNVLSNSQQTYVALGSINMWDNGYSSGGNYWSDYNGTDNNQDGIGDTPYVIDANNTDHYPLMGTFQCFNVSVYNRILSQFEEVDIISNSTIGQVYLSWADDARNPPANMDWFLVLSRFAGQNGTIGFCRMTLPNDILNSTSYHIGTWTQWMNGNLTISKVLGSNGTHTTLYFTYEVPNPLPFPEFEIIIIPEFPSFLILPLFFIATLLAAIVYRKKNTKISGSP
jgi:parallel beta-helix repeat protein